ncbi:MAG: hypothetical protein HQL07_03890 [Nitrospirae bacterium]|nr:hypothetical protein [Magnetococcales bacterium]HAT48862.1 hypothetical protein [Alphaproteobacteria bacterium]
MGTPSLFEARGGISIGGAHFISGTGAPGGTGGFPDDAVKGSIYLDETNGQMYLKKTVGTGTDKWIRMQNKDDMDGAVLGLSWRAPAKVRDSGAYADLAAAEAAVNTGTIDGVTVAANDRILFDDITGLAKNVFIVTGTPGSGATLVEDGNIASKGDALYVQEGTDAGKQYAYNGTDWVQQGTASQTELGFIQGFIGKSANGSETPDYASNNVVTDGSSLETAIGALDAEIGAGVVNPQSRLAGPISDQAVNSNILALDTAIGPDRSSSYIADMSASVNEAISLLDSESHFSHVFMGRSAGDTNKPAWTSTNFLGVNQSLKEGLESLDTALAAAKKEAKTDNVTASTVVDSILVDTAIAVEWTVHCRSIASPAKIHCSKILAIHNGTASADATVVDFNEFSILRTSGKIHGLDFDVDINGVGSAQVARLKVSSTDAVDVRVTRSFMNTQ